MQNLHKMNITNSDMNDQPKTQEEIIITATSLHFGLNLEEFRAAKETHFGALYKRQVCMFLLRKRTFLSYPEIAKLFSLKGSAAKTSFTRINDLSSVDKRTINDLAQIKTIIDSFNDKIIKMYS